jgi:hypothetical protein
LAVAAEHWVIAVSEVVVEQAGFRIVVLPRVTQREIKHAEPRWVFIRRRHAERLLLIPLPDGCACGVGNKARRVEMIDVTSGPDASSP